MHQFCESLEVRALFSGGLGAVTVEYQAIVADAAALKGAFTAAASTYKLDAKHIAADIKVLGKNKDNSADINKLNKAVSAATSLDSKITNKIISAGKTALNRAKAAFLAEVAHPKPANALKLTKAVAALTNSLTPYEAALATDTAAGDANIAAALGVLVAANPTDTTLATDVSTSETNSSNALAALANEVAITNSDINKLVTGIT